MVFSLHPTPQFEREDYISLNGEWDFGLSKAVPGVFKFSQNEERARNIQKKASYPKKITVPFCIESRLSGIGYTGFVNLVWYRKTVSLSTLGRRTVLHIGAADYLASVIVNGRYIGRHRGGYTSFSFDITSAVTDGENEIFILCEDDCKNRFVPRGKQSERLKSHGCDYTRTTGIWQSVYIEYTPENYIADFRLYPDAENSQLGIELELGGKNNAQKLRAEAFFEGRSVGKASAKTAENGKAELVLKLDETHIWQPGKGELYDLELQYGDDRVKSYFGLRNVSVDGYKFLVNGKSVFQRLVLDQGFYKDGIYTAADDGEIKRDIELAMSLGFNGARLHQKVFDPRYLYYCDILGYLVWGEYASWGFDISSKFGVQFFANEWREAVKRDFNHPSIIGWCPFNETWDYKKRPQYDKLISYIYELTKQLDPTRPCIDTSGNYHVKTDIYDIHDYNCDVEFFKRNFDKFSEGGELYEHVLVDNPGRQKYPGGIPVMVSEYGGIKWEADPDFKSWGYGESVNTPEEFAERYCGLTDALINNKNMCGFCYTQLYDIEQEQNGLFTYAREKKFSDEIYAKIKASNTQEAAIEK